MSDDAQLMHWLGGHRAVVRGGSPEDHPDIETLTKHATGQLAGSAARAVTEHLLVCDDGRCVAFVRAGAEDVDAAAGLLYPAEGEAEGMHQRTFLCRELLWQHFEEMSREMNTPIDDLVEEAMQAYARQRAAASPSGHHSAQAPYSSAHDYSSPDEAPDMERTAARPGLRQSPSREAATMEAPAARPPHPAGVRPMSMPMNQMSPPPRMGGGAPMPSPPAVTLKAPSHPPGMPMSPPTRGAPPPMSRPFTQPLGHQVPAPPPPRGGIGATGRMPAAPPPPPPPSASNMPTGQRRHAPPPLPSSPMMAAPSMGGHLSLTYRGQGYDVNKDHFILGRSKTNADLILDDSNVSRQHAAIERGPDGWYIVDLGSTNGVYIGGVRVTRQRVEDGDVIEITTHQIFCTLQ
jgi:hypothetical protein